MIWSSKLEEASIDEIEKKIIPNLTAEKEKINTFIVQKTDELNQLNSPLIDIIDQLESFNQKSIFVKTWHKSTIESLVVKRNTLRIKEQNMCHDLRFLCDKQKKYNEQIAQAQKFAAEKKQIEVQNIQP